MKTTQIVTNTLRLSSDKINNNIDDILYINLKNDIEGKCSDIGYVLHNSLEIISRTIGRMVNVDDKTFVEFNIKYSVDILSPSEGDIYDNIIIIKKNKIGYICYYKYGKYDEKNSPLNIIIPKEYIKGDNNVGDEIKIKIIGCRIKFKSQNIQIIGDMIG